MLTRSPYAGWLWYQRGWRCRGLFRIGRGRFTNRPYVWVVLVGNEGQDATTALTRSPYVGWLWYQRGWRGRGLIRIGRGRFTNRPYVCGCGGRRGPGCDINTQAIALCGDSRGTNEASDTAVAFANRPYV